MCYMKIHIYTYLHTYIQAVELPICFISLFSQSTTFLRDKYQNNCWYALQQSFLRGQALNTMYLPAYISHYLLLHFYLCLIHLYFSTSPCRSVFIAGAEKYLKCCYVSLQHVWRAAWRWRRTSSLPCRPPTFVGWVCLLTDWLSEGVKVTKQRVMDE